MKRIDIKSEDCVALVADCLRSGGLVMHPTETCYGLAVDIFNNEALQKLYRVKQMDLKKPVSVLVNGLEMAREFAEFSELAEELALRFWPGPLSIVLPRKDALPIFLNQGHDFVSLRCSGMEFCSETVAALGRPVTTTSANLSGEDQLYVPDVSVLPGVDLLVDAGEIPVNLPSTIVKVLGTEFEVLRRGGVSL